MSGSDALTRDDDIDVSGIVTALKRRWPVIAIITILTAVCLFFLLLSLDEKYRSTARILVEDGNNVLTRTTTEANSQVNSNQADRETVRSEVEIVRSDLLIRKAIDKLYEDDTVDLSEFEDEAGIGSFLDSIFGGNKEITEGEKNAVLESFKDRLEVYAIENSRVIVVQSWAHDSVLAQKIVSALVQEYLDFKVAERTGNDTKATDWLDPRIKEYEQDVKEKEAAVAQFRSQEDLLRVDGNSALLVTQQLSEASRELTRLKTAQATTEARVESIRIALDEGASVDAIPEVLESPLIQRLREREADLQGQVSDLSVSLLPGHPRLKSAESQLARIRSQVRLAANDVVKSLERDLSATERTAENLERDMKELEANAGEVEDKLVGLRAREREAEAARELLAEYKRRSLEAKSRAGLALPGVEVISPASFPVEAYFPKVIPFTAAGTVAVFLLSVLGVIAGSLLFSSAPPQQVQRREVHIEEEDMLLDLPIAEVEPATEDEVAKSSGGPDIRSLLGVLGLKRKGSSEEIEIVDEALLIPNEPELDPAVEENPKSLMLNVIAAQSAMLSVKQVTAALAELGTGRLAVVSPGGQAGSVTACLLARHLAKQKFRVLLVDFAIGATTTEEMVGSKGEPGFFNIISGTVLAENAIHKDRKTQARIMTSGTLFPNQPMPSAEIISDTIDVLAKPFDFLVLDCGNAEIDDINVVSNDDTIAVVSAIKSSEQELENVVEDLEYHSYQPILRVAPRKSDMKFKKTLVS